MMMWRLRNSIGEASTLSAPRARAVDCRYHVLCLCRLNLFTLEGMAGPFSFSRARIILGFRSSEGLTVAKKLAKKIATKDAQCMLRLPPGLRDKVAARAAENGRSMNTEIVEAIERHLQGADRITRLWEFFERHRESLESVPLLRTAVENLEIFAERSGEFRGGLRALRGHQEADQPSVVGEPAERLKAAIDAMRTHSRDFEERIQATKREKQKDPPEVSDRRAPRRLGDLGGRLLRHFRKRGGNGAEGDCMPRGDSAMARL